MQSIAIPASYHPRLPFTPTGKNGLSVFLPPAKNGQSIFDQVEKTDSPFFATTGQKRTVRF
jgi:hypothetical protein